jgi:hypothetical protein
MPEFNSPRFPRKPMTPFIVYLSESDKERLVRLARKRTRHMSEIIRSLIRKEYKRNRKYWAGKDVFGQPFVEPLEDEENRTA